MLVTRPWGSSHLTCSAPLQQVVTCYRQSIRSVPPGLLSPWSFYRRGGCDVEGPLQSNHAIVRVPNLSAGIHWDRSHGQYGLAIAAGQKPTLVVSACPEMLRNSCAYGHERRNHCAFQPMTMRRARFNRGLPAEEFVELTPKPGAASLGATAPSVAEDAFGEPSDGDSTPAHMAPVVPCPKFLILSVRRQLTDGHYAGQPAGGRPLARDPCEKRGN